ncbi:MAG TPA: EamA family transporter [Jatrophihabitantaceae bacterium]
MRPVPPQVLLLGSIASVQFGAAFAIELFARAGPGGVVFLRLGLAALMLVAAVRPSLRGRTRGDLRAVLAYGLILGVMNWSFYESLDRLPIGVAVTIEFVGPLAVAIAGSRHVIDLLWAALAGGGVVLLAFRGETSGISAVGVLLALIAGACWAAYILVSKRVGATFAQLDGLAIALCVGTLVTLPVGLVQGGSALLHPAVLAGGVAVALLSSIIPYSLELIALRRLRAATFGLLMSLEPAVAALAGVIVLGQTLHATTAVAIAMVVIASVGTTLTGRRSAIELEVAAGVQ